MDDDFVLVPKDKVSKLEAENKALKEKIDSKVDKTDNTKFLPEIIKEIQDESKKERELILQHLNEIKELNKSTLNNILHKNENLDEKLESVVSVLSELVGTLSEFSDEMKGKSNRDVIAKLDSMKTPDMSNVEMKLDEIEDFMNKLKTLLSQIKPNDMRINP